MKTGNIIIGVLGGAAIYYGFIKKFDDGLTGIKKLTGKKNDENPEVATRGRGPGPGEDISTPNQTKPLGNQIMDAINNPNADLGLITENWGKYRNS